MSNQVYIGNLPRDANETELKELFDKLSIDINKVTLKSGFAFVECKNAEGIDASISGLKDTMFMNNKIVVEPSVAGSGSREALESRIRVSGVRVDMPDEELSNLLGGFGAVEKYDRYQSKDNVTQVVHVRFSSADDAKNACENLNGLSTSDQHSPLKAEKILDRSRRQTRNDRQDGRTGGRVNQRQGHTEFPLRILVASELVGAVIGRKGQTIRTITQSSRARVDVHRKDNAGSLEKAITIYGNPENCTNACKRILEVMKAEYENTNKNAEIALKILAHNNLIGRMIGKNGTNIKKVMEDTNTKLTVSNVNEVNSFNIERIITIKGELDSISKAESIISSKLRMSYESDIQSFAPQTSMFPGLSPMAMYSTQGMHNMRPDRYGGNGSQGAYAAASLGQTQGMFYGASSEGHEETAFIYIPNYSVGAIIGAKGGHIRNVMKFSGASLKIAPEETVQEPQSPNDVPERKVTIVGSPEAQWKAQYSIFEKIRMDYAYGIDDVRLTVEILIPSSQVGRLIGKGGQNVRDLQRSSGALIKLPPQSQEQQQQQEDTTVQISGQFCSVQSAQRRIRSMVMTAMYPQVGAPPPFMGPRGASPRNM